MLANVQVTVPLHSSIREIKPVAPSETTSLISNTASPCTPEKESSISALCPSSIENAVFPTDKPNSGGGGGGSGNVVGLELEPPPQAVTTNESDSMIAFAKDELIIKFPFNY
jgi:hypothetical protein